MRRALAAAALLCAAAVAFPEDAWVPGSTRRAIEEAVRAEDVPKALALLDGLLTDGAPRERARNVEAARAAWDLLPRADAAPRAARLLAEALRIDPRDQDGAWRLAQDVRKDLVRRVDVENGLRFLEKLAEIYPNEPLYRHDLALLALDGGRRAEARRHLEANVSMAPSDMWAAYQLARLLEEDDDPLAAVAVYDRIAAVRPSELNAHLYKAKVLAARDRSAARQALDAGERAAADHPNAAQRAEFLESVAYERRRLAAAERRVEAVGAIRRRIRWTTAVALAGLAFAAAALHRATRVSRN